MPRHVLGRIAQCLIFLTAGATLKAGPECGEGVTDAGSTRSTARTCPGSGPLSLIIGQLTAARSTDSGLPTDLEDMYLIRIDDPVNFTARTDAPPDSDIFDTQLWLFRLDNVNPAGAFGILANDEIQGGPALLSQLQPPATDGTGQTIPGAGLYLLAITGFNRDPVSAGGPIFNQAVRTEISGPDGAGGAQIHTAWTGSGVAGNYAIHLTHASIPPAIPAMTPLGASALGSLLLIGAWIVFRRLRVAVA